MEKNERSIEELLATMKIMQENLQAENPEELEELKKQDALFEKLSPMTRAREKAMLGLVLIFKAKNAPTKETIAALRKCLDLHSNDVAIAFMGKILAVCEKHKNIPAEAILDSFISIACEKQLQNSVDLAEIIDSLRS